MERGPKIGGNPEKLTETFSVEIVKRSQKNLQSLKPQSRKAFIEAVNEKFGEDFDTSAVPEEEAFYELLFESLKAAEVLGQDKESEGVTGPKAREHIFESLKALEEQLEELRTQRQEEIDTFAQENEQYTQACDELSQRLKQAETKREILRIARDLEDVRSHAERSHEIVQLERQKEGMEFHEFKYELQAENPGLTTEGFRRFYEQQKAAINEQERAKLEELLGGETLIEKIKKYLTGDLEKEEHENIMSTVLDIFSRRELADFAREVEEARKDLLEIHDIVFYDKRYGIFGFQYKYSRGITYSDADEMSFERSVAPSAHRSKVPRDKDHRILGPTLATINIQGQIKTESKKVLRRIQEAEQKRSDSKLDEGIDIYAQLAQEFDQWKTDPFEGMERKERWLYLDYLLGIEFRNEYRYKDRENTYYRSGSLGDGTSDQFTEDLDNEETMTEYLTERMRYWAQRNGKIAEELRKLPSREWDKIIVRQLEGTSKAGGGDIQRLYRIGDQQGLRNIQKRVEIVADSILKDLENLIAQARDPKYIALWVKDGKMSFLTQEQLPAGPRKDMPQDYVVSLEERRVISKDGKPFRRDRHGLLDPNQIQETTVRGIVVADFYERQQELVGNNGKLNREIQRYLERLEIGFDPEKAFEICKKIDHNREISKRLQLLMPEERLQIGHIMQTHIAMQKARAEQLQSTVGEEAEKVQKEIEERQKILGFIGRRITSRGYTLPSQKVASN